MLYVLVGIAGILAGFVIAWFARAKAYHKDVAEVLLRCLETEEEQAQALGKASMIDYIVEKKGMDYAIVHYGTIFHILRGIQKKDEKLADVETAIGVFLQTAMREDIKKYEKEKQRKNAPR